MKTWSPATNTKRGHPNDRGALQTSPPAQRLGNQGPDDVGLGQPRGNLNYAPGKTESRTSPPHRPETADSEVNPFYPSPQKRHRLAKHPVRAFAR
jgi:hypothetical protein